MPCIVKLETGITALNNSLAHYSILKGMYYSELRRNSVHAHTYKYLIPYMYPMEFQKCQIISKCH
jgi:hypothetical protein